MKGRNFDFLSRDMAWRRLTMHTSSSDGSQKNLPVIDLKNGETSVLRKLLFLIFRGIWMLKRRMK